MLLSFTSLAQPTDKYNLGFEDHAPDASLAEGWIRWGKKYDLSLDPDAHSGKMSAKITSDPEGSSRGSVAYKIPANFSGSIIQLEGYMKTKNVENGFAGLLLRVDAYGTSLVFDNMQRQNIKGTRDWQKYTITLDYPEEAETIVVAGILSGRGEAWFDDFVLSIDGKDVQTLQEVEKVLPRALLDKEFDSGSKIVFPELTPGLTENLALLGRVWGFLKYHHPQVAKGNYNWDYELFRFLPKFLDAPDEAERDRIILDWIGSLGEVAICKSCAPTDGDAVLRPDLKWIKEVSDDLKKKLRYLYKNRTQGEHHYVEMMQRVGNPSFTREEPYATMTYPDMGFRLLALYRYWNMIHYFFPYKHLMDENWNTKLVEYLPRFLHAQDELEYELAALQLIGSIQDTHANLWGGGDKIEEWKGLYYPPVHLRFIEDQLVVTDYYNPEMQEDAGLTIGDIITKIDGIPVAQLVEERLVYYPASNRPTALRDLAPDLLRSTSNTVEIEFSSNDDRPQTKTLSLYPKEELNIFRWYPKRKGKSYTLLENNIGYVTLQNIKEADIARIRRNFRNTKGIIIDIRNYPSTFVPFSLGSYFVFAPTPFAKFTNGNVDNPGEFTFTDPIVIPNQGLAYTGKLVVLVNELSQSQAEYTAMAFRAGDDTTIMGSTTAGADGNISQIVLPGGLRTIISGIGVNYPDGKETQRIGIVPDIEVHPTIEGTRAGKDELLEKAIAVILDK